VSRESGCLLSPDCLITYVLRHNAPAGRRYGRTGGGVPFLLSAGLLFGATGVFVTVIQDGSYGYER
jgi:hypothetical protein